MYISWWVHFVTGLNYVLQQALTARLAKTKADIANKSTHSLLSETYAALNAYQSWFKVCIGNFSRADTLSDPIIAWLDFFSNLIPLCSRARVHISNWYFLLGRAPGFYPDRHCQGEPIFTPSNRLFEFFIRKQLKSLYLSRLRSFK